MKYYLIAGEASGDLHGANLMKAIARQDSEAQFRFFGGDLMTEAGGTRVRHYRELAYMGFWPVLTHLGTILRSVRICFEDISQWQPDAVILIDYPGFNLSIARMVRKNLGTPVYYYISPKIWAWKSYRIRNIRRDVDRLFSILPFEVDYFAQRGYHVDYVGNPCVDAVDEYRRSSVGNELQTDGRPVIALLAGSRRQEIRRNLPYMLEAVENLDEYEIILAAAPGIEDSFYDKILAGTGVRVERGRTYTILEHSRAALVTSGTATLETALLRVPQVVCYRLPVRFVARLFYRFVLKIRYVSLVNLIAGEEVVPELLSTDMNTENVRSHLLPLLGETPERQAQLDGYDRIISMLGSAGASEKAAGMMIAALAEDRK